MRCIVFFLFRYVKIGDNFVDEIFASLLSTQIYFFRTKTEQKKIRCVKTTTESINVFVNEWEKSATTEKEASNGRKNQSTNRRGGASWEENQSVASLRRDANRCLSKLPGRRRLIALWWKVAKKKERFCYVTKLKLVSGFWLLIR